MIDGITEDINFYRRLKMNIFKSKTIDFNILVPAIYAILKAFLDINIPEDVVIAIITIGNFILRFFTTKPLSEK